MYSRQSRGAVSTYATSCSQTGGSGRPSPEKQTLAIWFVLEVHCLVVYKGCYVRTSLPISLFVLTSCGSGCFAITHAGGRKSSWPACGQGARLNVEYFSPMWYLSFREVLHLRVEFQLYKWATVCPTCKQFERISFNLPA